MATKVYWKALELNLDIARRYIQRWQPKLEQNLTAEQYACVVATLNAILECLAILPINEPNP